MMNSLQDKIKNNRTRPAEIQGEPVQVKVYSAKEWLKISKKLDKFEDQQLAEFMANQFLGDDGKPVLTAEFILSEDCPTCVAAELVQIIQDVNMGVYEKK
jgi:hypothetical protein